MLANKKQKIVVAVTGASGSIYAKCLIEKLMLLTDQVAELSIVFSSTAKQVWDTELDNNAYQDYSAKVYGNHDFNAPFASGSAKYTAMFVVPCSMGTLGRIAAGISNDLITRAADVMLKERRRLVCVAREAPYNLVHIRNMETITLAGGIICPASPSFYSKPKTIEDVAATVVDRALQLAGLQTNSFEWGDLDE